MKPSGNESSGAAGAEEGGVRPKSHELVQDLDPSRGLVDRARSRRGCREVLGGWP